MAEDYRLQRFDDVVRAALDEAARQGVYLIARLQDRSEREMAANEGRLERVATADTVGLGVQTFSREGLAGFACAEGLEPERARELVRAAARLSQVSAGYGAEGNQAVFELEPDPVARLARTAPPLSDLSLEEELEAFLSVHRLVADVAPGVSYRSSHVAVDEEWRIVRSDGTDVTFGTPHAFIAHGLTARDGGAAASARASLSGGDPRRLLDADGRRELAKRLERSVSLVVGLPPAPSVSSGHYKLVLDYAMAKGLAHEAFGHAVETDSVETSVLGREGKLRLGERVADARVSIVDGPVSGDFAYQPVSANGVVRQTVAIVADGVLQNGLGDVFSAASAGAAITGAGRAASFRSVPLPRMSNIRIQVAGARPLPGSYFDLTEMDLRAALLSAGLMVEGEPVLYLTGYKGGQVNPREGEFVFGCTAIYDLTSGVALRQPAIFSGKILSGLEAIIGGLGDLHLDAMGHCGKDGQSVPSSGGSHAVLVLDRHPDIIIGGR